MINTHFKPQLKHSNLYVVGIAASAGGLEVLIKFLSNLKENGHLSYVIAQHMAKDGHDELMITLLQRNAHLPILEAKNGVNLQVDHVYLIPAGYNAAIENHQFKLSLPLENQISTPSANFLFTSIASNYGKNAIGLVLSGTGTDGVIGSRAIKAAGGYVIAQNPKNAPYSGMPSATIQAKVVDDILDVNEISTRLNEKFRLPNALNKNKLAISTINEELRSDENSNLTTLIRKIFEVTGIDFSNYKEDTLLRRLDRRMQTLKLTSIEQYLLYVNDQQQELLLLQHLFLVSLSSFFRDKNAFDKLKVEICNYIDTKESNKLIRVWVPACASGEECYTIAIIFFEVLKEKNKKLNIQIIGSDLNQDALSIAQAGLYRQTAFKETNQKILKHYFEQHGHHYKVRNHLKEVCEFVKEDVITAMKYEKVDLISCRNLLIYLKSPLQDQLFNQFYEALKSNGLLFIGQSESIGLKSGRLFSPIDQYHKIYRRKENFAANPVKF